MIHGLCDSTVLSNPNAYVQALHSEEFRKWVFSEKSGKLNKGRWRSDVFEGIHSDAPLDVEIGTGNGWGFQRQLNSHPDRLLVGLEIKFKPLMQSIRGALRSGSTNGRMVRYVGQQLHELFEEGEINDIHIYFPDPWTSPRKPSKRLTQKEVLSLWHKLQRPGSKVYFKTDSAEYFQWALRLMEKSSYQILNVSPNFYEGKNPDLKSMSFFEKLFVNEGRSIHYIELQN
jgi:tRNA (guanine-N7-)-methyltransferase